VPQSALFIVQSDPRTSPRPAEAIRIAAGVGTWRKVEVTLALLGPATLALCEFPDELVDEDNYVRYLPIVGEWGRPIYVQEGSPFLSDLGQSPVAFETISPPQLAALAARHDCVLRF
jgi:hypothetical protein